MATENKNLSQYNKDEQPDAKPYRFGIVVSQWNAHITHNLLQGAIDALLDLGAMEDNIFTHFVPGSFELIFGAQCLQNSCDVVIAIGSVIRGETAHFDFVCQGVTQGIAALNTQGNVPVIFCVLTDDNEQQSIDRSGGVHGNKGIEAAVAAVQMADFARKLSQ